jgi:hypothetical protein
VTENGKHERIPEDLPLFMTALADPLEFLPVKQKNQEIL